MTRAKVTARPESQARVKAKVSPRAEVDPKVKVNRKEKGKGNPPTENGKNTIISLTGTDAIATKRVIRTDCGRSTRDTNNPAATIVG